jgi:hypothetical protein
MKPTLFRAPSVWFSSLVALLVAIGSRDMLIDVLPTSFAEWLSVLLGFGPMSATSDSGIIYYVTGSGSFWPFGIVIQFVSFVVGGFVGVRLASAFPGRLIILLLAASLLAALFQQQPPGNPSGLLWALWFLAGPVGVVLGAWAANAMGAAAHAKR